MSFKSLTDNQILALAIDEWLMELDDDEWEKALRHIDKRKRQRARKKRKSTDTKIINSQSEKNSSANRYT
jgi:hypothetical protein